MDELACLRGIEHQARRTTLGRANTAQQGLL
jgi:hypothetical protein